MVELEVRLRLVLEQLKNLEETEVTLLLSRLEEVVAAQRGRVLLTPVLMERMAVVLPLVTMVRAVVVLQMEGVLDQAELRQLVVLAERLRIMVVLAVRVQRDKVAQSLQIVLLMAALV
jgi:hypothetical protein